jgi:hypothetical protein
VTELVGRSYRTGAEHGPNYRPGGSTGPGGPGGPARQTGPRPGSPEPRPADLSWPTVDEPATERVVPHGDRSRRLAGRYRLDEVIGRGGSGTVWAAYDEILRRRVAVKEVPAQPGMPPDEAQAQRERTLREARSIAVLSHPNVVTLFDVVAEQGEPYVVMELLRSQSLASVIAEHGPLTPVQAAVVGTAVADALAAAHAAGITHRDVKPGNVLISEDGQVKLADFGVARSVSEHTLTMTGMLLGSPAYMSPEVAAGGDTTPSADVWGLGATLFAAVEGRPPYDAGEPIATVSSVVHDAVPVPRMAGPLRPVLDGLLVKDPAARMPLSVARRLLAAQLPADPRAALARVDRDEQTMRMRRPGRPRGLNEVSGGRIGPGGPGDPAASAPLAADPGPLPFLPAGDAGRSVPGGGTVGGSRSLPAGRSMPAGRPLTDRRSLPAGRSLPAALPGPAGRSLPAVRSPTGGAVPAGGALEVGAPTGPVHLLPGWDDEDVTVPAAPRVGRAGGGRPAGRGAAGGRALRWTVRLLAVLLFAAAAAGGYAAIRVAAAKPLLPERAAAQQAGDTQVAAPQPDPDGDWQLRRDVAAADNAAGFRIPVPAAWKQYRQQLAAQAGPRTVVSFVSPDGMRALSVERVAGFYPNNRIGSYLATQQAALRGGVDELYPNPLAAMGAKVAGSPEPPQEATYRTVEHSHLGRGNGEMRRTTLMHLQPTGSALWVITVTVPTDQEDRGRELLDYVVPRFALG